MICLNYNVLVLHVRRKQEVVLLLRKCRHAVRPYGCTLMIQAEFWLQSEIVHFCNQLTVTKRTSFLAYWSGRKRDTSFASKFYLNPLSCHGC